MIKRLFITCHIHIYLSLIVISWLIMMVYKIWCAQYSKTSVKQQLLKRTKIGFQDQLLLNVGRKYCRMLKEEHSAILSTLIKLPFVIKIFVLSIFEWLFYTGFTVLLCLIWLKMCASPKCFYCNKSLSLINLLCLLEIS